MLNCVMIFSIFFLLIQDNELFLVLYWLFGLICNDENFIIKVGVQCIVVELDIVLVMLDISLCGEQVVDDSGYDLGYGVGFYFNVIQLFWVSYYCMYDYLCDEFLVFIQIQFNVSDCCVISGYLMGGYGVLIMVLKNLGKYISVFVFVFIVNFSCVLWGIKVFIVYFGEDELVWIDWDSCELMLVSQLQDVIFVFIDQGDSD